MIFYKTSPWGFLSICFTRRGSVFPFSIFIALPSAIISAVLQAVFPSRTLTFFGYDEGILLETQAWSGFTFLVGFLIVFRTSQAYSRFWEGCTASHQMTAEWFDAASSLMAFCKFSSVEPEAVSRFKHLLIRLVSMLHAAALADLESGHDGDEELMAWGYEIIDPDGVDSESIATLKAYEDKVELIFGWLQMSIVENIKTGVLSIPPPILSRVFQELANGMVAFHNAKKITFVPFPFPYAQTCDCLLMLHWLVVPLVTSQWTTNPLWAAVFCFIQVFILWSLNAIAIEIENPFGTDVNDIDGAHMQLLMNRHLHLLVDPRAERTPKLSRSFMMCEHGQTRQSGRVSTSSFQVLLAESRNPSKTSENTHKEGGGKPEDDRSCCFSDVGSPEEQPSSEAGRRGEDELLSASGRPDLVNGSTGQALLCELHVETAKGANSEDMEETSPADVCSRSSNADGVAAKSASPPLKRTEDIEVGSCMPEGALSTGPEMLDGKPQTNDWEEFEREAAPRGIPQPRFSTMESGADDAPKVPALRSDSCRSSTRLVTSLPPADVVFSRNSVL